MYVAFRNINTYVYVCVLRAVLMEMETTNKDSIVPTEQLREKLRNYSRRHREGLRASASDSVRFGLGEIKTEVHELDELNEKDVKGLAVRIKRRRHATEDDMYRLCHAFLQSEINIVTFANSGAIPIIVKEFTGRDASRQLSAAECLCNLTLGPTAVCDKIVGMAGSYLVTFLDTMEEKLKRTCLWVLTNILATGCGKGSAALMQMELVPKLWSLYTANNCEAPYDYRDDAGLVLQQISLNAQKLLRPTDIVFIREHLSNKAPTDIASEYHLQIIFNCDIVCKNAQLSESSILYLINYSVHNLVHTRDFASLNNKLKILYAVRILGNLFATQTITVYTVFLEQITNTWQTTLPELLNKIIAFDERELNTEILWLIRNLMQTKLDNTFLEHLRIPNTMFVVPS